MNSSSDSSLSRVSRRQFLQTTSSALAGTALAGALSVERGAHAAGSDLLKLALVGCGGRGSGAAGQALSTSCNLKLIAMADLQPEQLEKGLANLKKSHAEKVEVPKEQQFNDFDGYKKAIALADVVILATSPGFRPVHFEEAVRQGKHVFMEKPVATDAPGVRRVLAAAQEAKKKNLKVGVGLQRHHQLGYLETIKRLHGGEIGDVVSMRCYWNDGGVWVHPREELEKQYGRKLTEMEFQLRNWYYFTWIGGDHIVEQHIHNLDVINWVKRGYPVRCHGMGGAEVRKGPEYGEIFDHHAVEFEYADGSRCFSQCRHIRGCWTSVSEHVVGSKGICHVGGGRGEHTLRDHKGEITWRFEAEKVRD